jgi:hypothetical protein
MSNPNHRRGDAHPTDPGMVFWKITEHGGEVWLTQEEFTRRRKRGGIKLIPERIQNRLTLRAKQPAQWIQDLALIEDEAIRGEVARIIWWDFFSGKIVPNRVTEFDPWIKTFNPVEVEDKGLIAGMLLVGFSELEATSRLYKNRGERH